MGNKVSLNVGCCRRGRLFKLKIDTSDELTETAQSDQSDTVPKKNNSKNSAKISGKTGISKGDSTKVVNRKLL